MDANQHDAQLRAVTNPRRLGHSPAAPKSDPSAKRSNEAHRDSDPAADVNSQPNSDWSFYNSGKSSSPDDNLKPAWSIPAPAPRTVSASTKGKRGKTASAPAIPANSYTLQVAATRSESDAMSLASHLQKQKFPAFVVSLQRDKYYRVHGWPYADPKSADTARQGLEGAGFKKLIVKH